MKPSLLPLTALLALGTGLSACTMTPDYMRPNFSAASAWPAMPDYETPEGEIAAKRLSWHEFFKDPALHQIIETTLEHNKDLRLAALNIEEARALYRIERADTFPALKGNMGATYQESSDEGSPTGRNETSELYTSNLGVSAFEVDLFGRLRSQNKAAFNEYLATQAARDGVQNILIAEVVNTYLQLLSDQKLLAVTQETLEAQQRTYDILSQTRDAGIATESDVSRAETAVETARVNLHQYHRLVAQDQNALILLMGIKNNETPIPPAHLSEINLPHHLDAGIPSDVLMARPDIRKAEYELIARNADIGAARAAFFPRISLTGTYGFASEGLSQLFTNGSLGAWTFVPQITLPIFNAGQNRANLKLADIRKDQAVTRYEKAIQTAFREVSDELAARATLTAQLEAQRRLVAAAERVYNISDQRYKSGIDSFLSVLDAQRELYTSQQNEIQIERQRLTNLVTLYKVLGGGGINSEAKTNADTSSDILAKAK